MRITIPYYVWSDSKQKNFSCKGFEFIEKNFSSHDQNLIFSLKDAQDRTPHLILKENKGAAFLEVQLEMDR